MKLTSMLSLAIIALMLAGAGCGVGNGGSCKTGDECSSGMCVLDGEASKGASGTCESVPDSCILRCQCEVMLELCFDPPTSLFRATCRVENDSDDATLECSDGRK